MGSRSEAGEGTSKEAAILTTTYPAVTDNPEIWVELLFTWSAKPYTLRIAETDRVFDLKAALHDLTKVPPERQKILGLVKGKLPPDQDRIPQCRSPPRHRQKIYSDWYARGRRNKGSLKARIPSCRSE